MSPSPARSLSVLLAVLALITSLLTAPAPAAADEAADDTATSGALSVLTYNVAGLPEFLTDPAEQRPSVNTPVIGRRIEPYDVVHVQEDFNYHAALYANNDHPHRTPTSGGVPFGDGLNTLSHLPYSDFHRVRWNRCNGTDCLTPKGFTASRVRLAEGVYVDLYNMHANAGVSNADLAARRANITQLTQYIERHSAGNAVIVAGDTNTRYTRAGDNIRELADTLGLTDAWVEHVRGGSRPQAGSPALVCQTNAPTEGCEVVDKILYRSGAFVELRLADYRNDHADFLDADGRMLSDHYPHTAEFDWSLAPGVLMSDLAGGPHGTPFTDAERVVGGAEPVALSLRAGARVDQVAMDYAEGGRTAHGGSGGTARSLTLEPGEHLVSATLSTGQRNGRTRVFHAEFATDRGRTLSGGTATSDTVTFTAPDGWRIAGFHGRAGDEVDKLGLIYTPVP
ncbi:endonuclease [Nocardiopsis exhalans]|uniref:Endonuclease n=1 Tax=Nocardiopsis exhalans TaxID=163604 RepID=A0ABY5D6A5_9ACTN|nr:jacalin-like lectin [Nocardiopsis exhalans]USY18789.1 endonuclease [Nocardiopsis exhalans]